MHTSHGIITAIMVQKRTSRCSIFVNGEFYLGCSIDIATAHGLRKGMNLTEELAQKLHADNRRYDIKQKALNYATYKPRTVGQVRQAMHKKGYTPEEIEYCIAFLHELDYLDDTRYAQTFIREYSQRKKAANNRLRIELTKRFIPKTIIEKVLQELAPTINTTELCKQAAEKKLRALQSRTPEKRKTALMGFLQRQGFSWHDIKQVLQEYEIQ